MPQDKTGTPLLLPDVTCRVNEESSDQELISRPLLNSMRGYNKNLLLETCEQNDGIIDTKGLGQDLRHKKTRRSIAQ